MPSQNDDCLLILDYLYEPLEIKVVPYSVYCALEEASTEGLPSELDDLCRELLQFPTVSQDDIVNVPEFTCIRLLRL